MDSEARIRTGLRRMKAAVARRPERFLVVPYPELVADPTAAVERICRWADRPFDRRAEAACRQYLARQVRGGPHRYRLEQYGLEREALLAGG